METMDPKNVKQRQVSNIEETYTVEDLIQVTQDAICDGKYWNNMSFQGALVGKDKRCYQFFNMTSEPPCDGDIRTVYCKDSPWTTKADKSTCGNSGCGKPSKSWCGRCSKVGYCSRECQSKAWVSHKTKCRHTYTTVEFWRWFTIGKCSIIHHVFAELVKELLSYNELIKQGTIKTLKGGELKILISFENEMYKVTDACLSGPYRHINTSDREKLRYDEVVFIFDNLKSNFKEETISLNLFRQRDIDRMDHVSSGTDQMKKNKCRNESGKLCEKQFCVLPSHLKIHQLCVLKVEKYNENGNDGEKTLKKMNLYVDIAGMQYGQDKILIVTQDQLTSYYERTESEHNTTAYSMENNETKSNDTYHVPDEMEQMTKSIVIAAVRNLMKKKMTK